MCINTLCTYEVPLHMLICFFRFVFSQFTKHSGGGKKFTLFFISNFRPVLNVARYLLRNFPASEFYMPTFRNTLPVPSS